MTTLKLYFSGIGPLVACSHCEKNVYPDLRNQGPSYNPGNPPPYVPQQETIVVTSPPVVTGVSMMHTPGTVIVGQAVGPKPTHTTCRSCRAEIVTRVEHSSTTRTHIMALLLCLFCCWPCVCIPYCTDSCRNADHYCPNCNSYIGAYQN